MTGQIAEPMSRSDKFAPYPESSSSAPVDTEVRRLARRREPGNGHRDPCGWRLITLEEIHRHSLRPPLARSASAVIPLAKEGWDDTCTAGPADYGLCRNSALVVRKDGTLLLGATERRRRPHTSRDIVRTNSELDLVAHGES